jgi:hypothetical protein
MESNDNSTAPRRESANDIEYDDDNFSSAGYRQASANDHVTSCAYVEEATPMAMHYAEEHGTSLDDALKVVLDSKKLDSNDILWNRIELEPEDVQVGTVFICKEIQVCTNSKRIGGRYNDTYAVSKTKKYINYNKKSCEWAGHSGDISTEYGLRHTIISTKEIINMVNEEIYIFSASWLSGRKENINVLTETHPIMEFRTTNNDNTLKRYVIPQKFTSDGNYTSCAGAKITHDGKNYRVEVISVFCGGYADDINTSIKDVISHFEKQSIDSMMAGGEAVMHPMMDDSPSEMYDDYVQSVVSNANLDDYHAVSSV